MNRLIRPRRSSVLRYPHRFCCAPTSRSNNFQLCRFMALSWPNLPCALKAAIGIGKRTLGNPRQRAAPRGGPHQGPRPYRGSKTSRTIATGPRPCRARPPGQNPRDRNGPPGLAGTRGGAFCAPAGLGPKPLYAFPTGSAGPIRPPIRGPRSAATVAGNSADPADLWPNARPRGGRA